MALTYDKVIGVISQTPDKRKDFEVNNLLPWFRKKSDLFRNLKTELLFDIIKHLQFVKKNRDDLIIRQGDQGDCMYILLRGRVTIYIFYNKTEADDDQSSQPVISAKTESIRTQLGTFVTHLGPGATFGEVALMNDDAPRTASIIADEKTELIVIDRDLYNRSVKNVLKKEFEDKSNFIASNPYFQSWPPKYKKQLAMALQKETFPYEGVMAKQGDPLEAIYFILTGEIKVLMDPQQHLTQYPKIFHQGEEPVVNGNQSTSDHGEQAQSDDLLNSMGSGKDRNGLDATIKFRKPKPKKQSNEICLLALNESIGDIEVFLDMDTYMQTALCTQKTEVLVMEIKHYERLLVKRNPKTIEQMKANLELRIQSRMTKHIEKTIPVLKCLFNKAQEYNLLRAQQSEARQQKKEESPAKGVKTISASFDAFVPPRGPLIDMYGPGTVFHRIRQRAETKALRAKKGHQLFGGYQGPGAGVKPGRENGDIVGQKDLHQVHWGTAAGNSGNDEATSDPALTKLENRMRQWLRNDPNPSSRQRGEPRIAKLQRSQTEAEQELKPGAKVVLRPKPLPVIPTETPPGLAIAESDDDVYVHHGHAWVGTCQSIEENQWCLDRNNGG